MPLTIEPCYKGGFRKLWLAWRPAPAMDCPNCGGTGARLVGRCDDAWEETCGCVEPQRLLPIWPGRPAPDDDKVPF